MNDVLTIARAAALKIQRRTCCYAGSRYGTRRFCDCKYLSRDRLGGMSSEETGCAEARAIISLVQEVQRTGSFDPEDMQRCRSFARRLQRAGCYAAQPQPEPVQDLNQTNIMAGAQPTLLDTRFTDTMIGDSTDTMVGSPSVVDFVRPPRQEEPEDTTEIPASPRCKCGCNPLQRTPDTGYGCFEAWVIRDALRQIINEYPARVSDPGVPVQMVLVVNFPTVVTVNIKPLVSRLGSAGNLLPVLASVYRALKLANEQDPIVLQLEKLCGSDTGTGDELIDVGSGVLSYQLPQGVILPPNSVATTLQVSRITSLVIASRDGVIRFLRACIDRGGLKEELKDLLLPLALLLPIDFRFTVFENEPKAEDSSDDQ